MSAPTCPTGPAPAACHGFTLVELCCTVALIAVVAGLALPAIGHLIALRRLDGAAATLAADLQFAKVLATSLGEPVRWSLNHGPGGSCYLVHRGPAGSCRCTIGRPPACTDGGVPARSVMLPVADRVTLEGNVGSIVFEPQLGSAAPTGTLRLLGADGRAVHCIVNLMGRVRLCAPGGPVRAYRPC